MTRAAATPTRPTRRASSAIRLTLSDSGRPHRAAGDHLQGAARPGGAPGRRPVVQHRQWVHFALLNAEELGVTPANVEEMKTSANPEIKRLLGTDGTFGEGIGLGNDWAANVIKAVGNYGEIFERNIGAGRRRSGSPAASTRSGRRAASSTHRRSARLEHAGRARRSWPASCLQGARIMAAATTPAEMAASASTPRRGARPLRSDGARHRLPGRRWSSR